jgi:hypothetical protein
MTDRIALPVLSKAQATKLVTVEYLIGPDDTGPEYCIHCRRLFVDGDRWQRISSPPDPEYGSYRIGIHDACSLNRRA